MKMNINIRYLEVLEAIQQTGTFTGAAKKLHLTQSAVSHAIAELEQQTAAPLFDRLPRGVRLTHYGKALLEEAGGILAACRSLEGRIHRLEESIPVNIVSSITVATFLLPQMIQRLQKRIPTLRVKVRVVSAACAMEILRKGEADIAFIEGAEPQGLFRVVPSGSYRLCAACAPESPWPGRIDSLRELSSYPLLLREPGSAIRDAVDGILSLANQKAYPLWESVNSFALIKAAEAGLGITILPELLLKDAIAQNRLRVIETARMNAVNEVMAVFQKDKYITQGMQAVLEELEESGRTFP